MDRVTRYSEYDIMDEECADDQDSFWCKAEDVEHLETSLAKAERERDELREEIYEDCDEGDTLAGTFDRLRKGLDEAREESAALRGEVGRLRGELRPKERRLEQRIKSLQSQLAARDETIRGLRGEVVTLDSAAHRMCELCNDADKHFLLCEECPLHG